MKRKGFIPVLGALCVWVAALGVSSGQIPRTDSQTAAATVVTVVGQVSVLKDSEPWALSVGAAVKPRQIVLTGPDGYAQFKLADGSTFEVFPNSRVTFRNTPGDWTDLLEVLLGRIKVHIQKLEGGQPNPNKVRTPAALISVRGTIFDVVVQDGESTLVSVEEGQVVVSHLRQPGPARILNSGDSLEVLKNVPLARQTVDRMNVIKALARAAQDALYTAQTTGRGPTGTGGTTTPGGGLPGDHKPDPGTGTGGTTPTPPPPPPPPPPPGQ